MVYDLQQDALIQLQKAGRALERLAIAIDNSDDNEHLGRAMPNSTRAVIKILDSWCVEYAVRSEHPAMSDIDKANYSDTEVLNALKRYQLARRRWAAGPTRWHAPPPD